MNEEITADSLLQKAQQYDDSSSTHLPNFAANFVLLATFHSEVYVFKLFFIIFNFKSLFDKEIRIRINTEKHGTSGTPFDAGNCNKEPN